MARVGSTGALYVRRPNDRVPGLPQRRYDIETVPSNLAFDADLKARDPRWGLRRVEDFADAASEKAFELVETRAMPANNLMLLFRLRESPIT